MSKEQTPIESLIIDLKIMAKIPDNYTLPMIIEMIENEYLPKEQQYAQAKVLEGIEREWIDVKQQPKESGEYLVSMVGGVDIAMYYKDTNEWKSVDRPLKNAYGKQVIRETLSPTDWMKLPKQK